MSHRYHHIVIIAEIVILTHCVFVKPRVQYRIAQYLNKRLVLQVRYNIIMSRQVDKTEYTLLAVIFIRESH